MTARTYGTTSKGALGRIDDWCWAVQITPNVPKPANFGESWELSSKMAKYWLQGGYKKATTTTECPQVRYSFNYEVLRNAGAAAVAESGDATPTVSVGIAGRRRRLRLGKNGPLGIGRSSKSREILVED